MRELFRRFVFALLTKLAFAFGLAGIMGALVIVSGQGLSWLQFETWPEVSILHGVAAFGFRPPTSARPSIQKIIGGALGLPLSVVVLLLGIGLRQVIKSWLPHINRGKGRRRSISERSGSVMDDECAVRQRGLGPMPHLASRRMRLPGTE